MIYFNPALQRQMIMTFHYALEPGGYMLLGVSEGLRDYGDVFSTVDRKNKIYVKTGANLPLTYETPRNLAMNQTQGTAHTPLMDTDNNVWPEVELQRAADCIVLARFGPPGLIIDERMNVLQSRGGTSSFLDITPGAVSWNLLRVLRVGLVNDVSTAVQRAIHENVPASTHAVLQDAQAGERHIQVDVLPITSMAARRNVSWFSFKLLLVIRTTKLWTSKYNLSSRWTRRTG
jgi:two-component system CheB/CheR fusion protein